LKEELNKLEIPTTGLQSLTLLTSDGQNIDQQETLSTIKNLSTDQCPKIFVLGDDFSSENDLVFVNKIWKKFEDSAGKRRRKLFQLTMTR